MFALCFAKALVRQGSYQVLTPKFAPDLSSTLMIDGDITTFVDVERLAPEVVAEHFRRVEAGVAALRRLRRGLSWVLALPPVLAFAGAWFGTGDAFVLPGCGRLVAVGVATLSGAVARFVLISCLRRYARFI